MPKLPKEAVKFAKSMGLDLSGLEPEAEDIWKMLDDMSTKDPMQYEEFVRQQFESAKDAGDKKEPAEAEKRSFRPAGMELSAQLCIIKVHVLLMVLCIHVCSWVLCGDHHTIG